MFKLIKRLAEKQTIICTVVNIQFKSKTVLDLSESCKISWEHASLNSCCLHAVILSMHSWPDHHCSTRSGPDRDHTELVLLKNCDI